MGTCWSSLSVGTDDDDIEGRSRKQSAQPSTASVADSASGLLTTQTQVTHKTSNKKSTSPKALRPRKKASKPPPTPPVQPSTRTRADTWETNLLDGAVVVVDAAATAPMDTTVVPTDAEPRDEGRRQDEVPSSTPSSKGSTNMPVTNSIADLQEQWKRLWDSQSTALVDPSDICAVWDSLVAKTIHALSPVQITLLQRKVRAVVKALPARKGNDASNGGTTPTTTASKLVAKVFAGASSSNANHTTLDSLDTEARNVMERYHLLTPTVLQRVLPRSPVVDSIITLLVAFGPLSHPPLHNTTGTNVPNGKDANGSSESNRATGALLTERVLTAAHAAVQQAGLQMDANQQKGQKTNGVRHAMPKPSQVPELNDPVPEWPVGASFTALSAVVALATSTPPSTLTSRSSRPQRRAQRLQLLFYCLMDAKVLREFLASHPAGGIPVWLLEVGNSTVLSVPSLTHYHYYGNAFVPCAQGTQKASTTSMFVPSKSRSPVTVSSDKVQQVLRDALRQAAMVHRTKTTPSNGTAAASAYPFDEGRVSSAPPARKDGMSLMAPMLPPLATMVPFRKSSSTNDLTHLNASNHESDQATNGNHHAATVDAKCIPHTGLMRHLHDVTEGIAPDPYSPVPVELDASVTRFETATTKFLHHLDVDEWTLEEYKTWADDALDDVALDVIMHRLFAQGLLPSPAMERNLVLDQWVEWQDEMQRQHTVQVAPTTTDDAASDAVDGQSVTELLTTSVSALLGGWSGPDDKPSEMDTNGSSETAVVASGPRVGAVWGGIGGIDGLGGLGYGVLYCIPRTWWESWAAYTGWGFVDDLFTRPQRTGRPDALQTESLLEKDPDVVIRGVFGSYEVMKQGIQRGKHYVLVPPGVWDTLYELYSGGPPLPRMVQPLERDPWSTLLVDSTKGVPLPVQASYDEMNDGTGEMDVRRERRVVRIPDQVSVVTHPVILHVHLCDPIQPCRRGDTGPVSIRVMACLNQPLWRLFGEIICRFSLHSYKAFDADGRGMARIWKKVELNKAKDAPISRFGPWSLLCLSRHATVLSNWLDLNDETYQSLITDWKRYGDNATVESAGLLDHHGLMLEFAVQNKNGELTWPRELAAQAGKVRRLADEDKKLKQLLQGVDEEGKLQLKPPSIIGLDVDAMDSSGRWYTVKILEVKIIDDDTDEENDDDEEEVEDKNEMRPLSKKRVRVSFREFGGHFEWIDVESDRITTAGRIVNETEQQAAASPSNGAAGGNGGDGKSKSGAGAKRTNSNAENTLESAKACALPGFGSCGLTNLGNTCYMNSAVQCMAYLPLLRAYLLSAQYKASGDLNKDNPLGTGGKLLEEFANMQKFIWSARIAEHTPNRFRAQLGKTNDQFSGADQQDAQEFLNYMIDVLHEDSNRVRKKPYVEALEDDWVEQTDLPRVGEEAWRRFLRRNQSIMADVAMGQALNTVTCPVCRYSSRNFDPFNLLSIPIPTVADVIFQCTLIRRSTARNCPSILNRPRKNDTRPGRFPRKLSELATGPPSESFVAEQYVIALSRLADGGDLRLQLQNLSGIRANQLRLCRVDEVVNEDADDESVAKKQTRVILLTDKEGPVSQHAKKRATDDGLKLPTQIIAFEMTLSPRLAAKKAKEEGNETSEAENDSGNEEYPSSAERAEIEEQLSLYGDEKECRQVDTDPLIIAMAVSRSLWPRNMSEMKIGLRVDVKDHRGFWVTASVAEIEEEDSTGGNDTEGQEVVAAPRSKKIRIHPDIVSPKWDEFYTIDHFKKGKVNPVYSQVEPKGKSTEFLVHHRCVDKTSGQPLFFGQSFYIQCHKEWTNARAGAHILSQTSRFLRQKPNASDSNRLVEKVQSSISELIDLLIDCDREFIKLVLGVSKHSSDEEKARAYRNAQFDTSVFIAATNKKVTTMLHRLPFELRLFTTESNHGSKYNATGDEVPFSFALNVTVGNYIRPQSNCILHWREPPVDKKNVPQRSPKPSILYVEPQVHTHESSAELLKAHNGSDDNGKKAKPGNKGIDLGFCLTEFCKIQKLPMSDNWKCPRCKRFNMSARWHEKITTKVNFPMTGLDMSEWCHKESPVLREESEGSYIYDLIGVMNHYGSMTGGHYVATCKATHCGRDGKEEVAYDFNGVGASHVESNGSDEPSGFFLTRAKPKVNQSRLDAVLSSQAVADSAEPTWLQFDDEIVEAIPPRHVVSEMAYVLFYRKRRITPSNIAKYSTLE